MSDQMAPGFTGRGGRSFIVPSHKVAYIAVSKAACTSLKWMVADLAGEDHDALRQGASYQQDSRMRIHTARQRFRHVRHLDDLSAAERDQISPANGWFVFSMVRDPRSRLWSAWQSKFLVRHAGYAKQYEHTDFWPRIAADAEAVVADFHRFVELRPWVTHPALRSDAHFLAQAPVVSGDGLDYSRVYDLSEFATMIADLHHHLRGIGKDHELFLPRANEMPLGLTRAVLADGVAEQIEEIFADDFEVFGHLWDIDRLRFVPDGWSREALGFAAHQAEINAWIRQINDTWRDRLSDRRALLDELEEQNAELRRAQKRRLGGRLSRLLRRS